MMEIMDCIMIFEDARSYAGGRYVVETDAHISLSRTVTQGADGSVCYKKNCAIFRVNS